MEYPQCIWHIGTLYLLPPGVKKVNVSVSESGRYSTQGNLGSSLAVVRSYALGCEPLVTGNLAMGLTIRSSHKQEFSSVYQFIDVLYSLCIYEALRH